MIESDLKRIADSLESIAKSLAAKVEAPAPKKEAPKKAPPTKSLFEEPKTEAPKPPVKAEAPAPKQEAPKPKEPAKKPTPGEVDPPITLPAEEAASEEGVTRERLNDLAMEAYQRLGDPEPIREMFKTKFDAPGIDSIDKAKWDDVAKELKKL